MPLRVHAGLVTRPQPWNQFRAVVRLDAARRFVLDRAEHMQPLAKLLSRSQREAALVVVATIGDAAVGFAAKALEGLVEHEVRDAAHGIRSVRG